jgi:TATA-box binding protein (TBP) (component of TFIID and TFIIIB)
MADETVALIKSIPSRASCQIAPTVPNLTLPHSTVRLEGIEPILYIRNVVATYSIGVRVNLQKLAFLMQRTLPGKYNPTGFAAMRITVFTEGFMKTVALLFSNGIVVHAGGRSEEHTLHDAWALCAYLAKKLGIPASLHNFCIRNIVSSFQFGHPIDCFQIAEKLGLRASFDPEDIQCCFIRDPEQGRRVALVFLTGGCVITGVLSHDRIEEAFRQVYEIGASVRHHFGTDSKSSYRIRHKRVAGSEPRLRSINKSLTRLTQANIAGLSSGRKQTAAEQRLLTSPRVKYPAAPFHGSLLTDASFQSEIEYRPTALLTDQ